MSPVAITRAQRQALYAELVLDLTAVGDIYIALDKGDYASAQRFRRQFDDTMCLLDDIGWESDPPGEQFEITMAPDQLARAMGPPAPAGVRCARHACRTTRRRGSSRRATHQSLRRLHIDPCAVCRGVGDVVTARGTAR